MSIRKWHQKLLPTILAVLIGMILLGMLFHQAIATHVRAVLLLSQQFHLPVQLLHATTNEPSQEHLLLPSKHGKVVVDVVSPKEHDGAVGKQKKPAIIVAMGVKTSEKDKPVILDFAKNLARIGYIVLWPRLETLDNGVSGFEQPETFLAAFEYVKGIKEVESTRISFVGFSVGSSIAMVAASEPAINNNVHGFVFFGGYYDVFSYLRSVATRIMVIDGQDVAWEPAEGVTSHLREIGEETRSETLRFFAQEQRDEEIDKALSAVPKDEIETLKGLSPKEHLVTFKTPIFILHEKSDNYVPYVESIKLKEALAKERVRAFTLVNLFEHVQPKKGFSPELLGEFFKLYGFLYEALNYL